MREYANKNGGDYLRREYDYLRREYEDLRRPFNATPDAPFTDVWDFKTVQAYDGKHVCEKPLDLMQHIIRLSSRPDALVCDPFVGSGTTAEAAITLGRRFTGCDIDPEWSEYSVRRAASACFKMDNTDEASRRVVNQSLPLFEGDNGE